MKKIGMLIVIFAILAMVAVPLTAKAQDDPRALAHEARVRELAEVYADQGFEDWLEAAGYSWNTLSRAARQPEELILSGDIVIAGWQVTVTDLSMDWPAGMTTDQRVITGDCVQPDKKNPSKVCTNVERFDGTATLWVSVMDWGQFDPENVDFSEVNAAAPASEDEIIDSDSKSEDEGDLCLSLAELSEMGTVLQILYNGDDLAGVQIRPTESLSLEGWALQVDAQPVDVIQPTMVGTAWSPENCRPLSWK